MSDLFLPLQIYECKEAPAGFRKNSSSSAVGRFTTFWQLMARFSVPVAMTGFVGALGLVGSHSLHCSNFLVDIR
jgi:hypothetical protein